MQKCYLGIDIGGMSVKFGLFDENINLIEKWYVETNTNNNGKYILYEIAEEIKAKQKEYEIIAIGAGVPGPVDSKGIVKECVNIGWGETDVKVELESMTGIKTTVLNDANAAALGENSEKYNSMVFVTIGTGVGGGIVFDGKVLTGFGGAAGEIGHITVNPAESEKCTCGKSGCLEQYSSATAIKKYADKLIADGTETMLKENFTVKDIFEGVEKGDALCKMVVRRASVYLGMALSNIACTINPEVFLIGGGVSRAGDTLLNPVKEYFKKFAFPEVKDTPIVIAEIGNDAGMYGAAKAAKRLI
ncbi:MAG: ROK family protein [Firmicutes bacterium]|nr:ROK family protein [Bacillota bacterium]